MVLCCWFFLKKGKCLVSNFKTEEGCLGILSIGLVGVCLLPERNRWGGESYPSEGKQAQLSVKNLSLCICQKNGEMLDFCDSELVLSERREKIFFKLPGQPGASPVILPWVSWPLLSQEFDKVCVSIATKAVKRGKAEGELFMSPLCLLPDQQVYYGMYFSQSILGVLYQCACLHGWLSARNQDVHQKAFTFKKRTWRKTPK